MRQQKIGEPEVSLLTLLDGCPDGATAYNLLTNHRVLMGTIHNLTERGLVHMRVNPVSGHSFSITRVFITCTGRAVLKGSKPCAPVH